MAEKHIADKEAEFVAVNGPPDMCRVGNSVIPFDITDTLDKARDPSANVHARGNPVLTQTTRVNSVAGDAGSGIVSGTSRGHTIVLQGSSTVFVNGKPCARHDDPVGMNCNGGDTFNTTGQLKTLKLGPKPKWGSKEAGKDLRERLKETSQELHDNPMGKTPEQAAAVQDKVKQLVTDTAEHEKAAMQSLRNGDTATWTEASTLKNDARSLVADAERQVKWANSNSKGVVDGLIGLAPGSGVPEAVQDGGKAWGAAKSGNYLGATGHMAMAVLGIATELPVLKQLKGAVKLGKAASAAKDATKAAGAAKDAAKGAGAAKDAGKGAEAAKDAGKGAEAAKDGAKAGEGAKDAEKAAEAKAAGGSDGTVIKKKKKEPGPCDHLRQGNGKGPYRGGAHSKTSKPANDGKDSHHMPADDVSPLRTNDGPAIQMDPPDHKLTKSNGSQPGSARYRQAIATLLEDGKWREAMVKEIKDIRRIGRLIGSPRKYNEASLEMLEYFKCLEKNGLLPKGAA